MANIKYTRKAYVMAALTAAAFTGSVLLESATLIGLAFLGLGLVLSTRFALSSPLGPARRHMELTTVAEDEALPVQLELLGPQRGSALLEVRDRLPVIASNPSGTNYQTLLLGRRESRTVQYDVVVPRLGSFNAGPLEVRREDPLGLVSSVERMLEPTPFLVRPRVEPLKRTPDRSETPRILLGRHDVAQPGEGFEFFGLRDYQPGDRIRMVNWKASARSPRLIVNQFERESHSEIALFLDAGDVSEVGVETSTAFVQCARAAASLAQRYVRARDRVRLVVYGPNVAEIRSRGNWLGVDEILDELARLRPSGDTPLLRAVERLLPTLRPRSPVIVLSSLMRDPTVEEAVGLLRSHELNVSVVAALPKTPPGEDSSWAPRLLERSLAIDAIQSLGATVAELDADEPLSTHLQGVR